MAKKDQTTDHSHHGIDHRRDFYGYSAGLPHGFEQYYSADFQAQVTPFSLKVFQKLFQIKFFKKAFQIQWVLREPL